MSTEKLALITTVLNGITTRSVEHPEHGPLIIASDLVKGLGYGPTATSLVLRDAAVPAGERVMIQALGLCQPKGHRPITTQAIFLTRKGVNLVLMYSGKPIAQETRQWLAGDVMPAIADTGGYLLNEAARETARADTRHQRHLTAA